MKKQILVLIILALVAGCKKYESTHKPSTTIYILKGDAATFYDNVVTEATGNRLIIKSGVQAYERSLNGDTLYKELWTGDVLSISAHSYTSIYYNDGTNEGYLVDSSANTQASITVK